MGVGQLGDRWAARHGARLQPPRLERDEQASTQKGRQLDFRLGLLPVHGDWHLLVRVRRGRCGRTWENFSPKPFGELSFAKDPCSYFLAGKVKASTLSLTVLVVIEMLNAFNALSEDGSLLQMPPWKNPYLIVACMDSMITHFGILYIDFFAKIFAVCPLDWHDWALVMAFSFPVIIIDEVLKFVGRQQQKKIRQKQE